MWNDSHVFVDGCTEQISMHFTSHTGRPWFQNVLIAFIFCFFVNKRRNMVSHLRVWIKADHYSSPGELNQVVLQEQAVFFDADIHIWLFSLLLVLFLVNKQEFHFSLADEMSFISTHNEKIYFMHGYQKKNDLVLLKLKRRRVNI